jgi:hypothetical protein
MLVPTPLLAACDRGDCFQALLGTRRGSDRVGSRASESEDAKAPFGSCRRCGGLLQADGLCDDETCPHSDVAQSVYVYHPSDDE